MNRERRRSLRNIVLAIVALASTPISAWGQRFTVPDSVIRRIWDEGMTRSQLRPLAQVLLDSIGPRLTGSPADLAGHDWLIAKYGAWGIRASNEQYAAGGKRWRRGATHVDLVAPRVRTLEAALAAWSPGTAGTVTAEAAGFPTLRNATDFTAALSTLRGKWVLLSSDPTTCRPDSDWERYADSATIARMRAERTQAHQAWDANIRNSGVAPADLVARLEAAGVAGFLTNDSYPAFGSGGRVGGNVEWGVLRTGSTTGRLPMIALSCEDYGLVARLARNGQAPKIRANAEAEMLGPAPVLNTIAEIRGAELPDEYVVLSAHFDSWDGGSGATDNGTGTLTMMEAMRILRAVYPRPRRTILVRHWSGEEQGIGTTRAFRADMTAVASKTQVVLNQDTGTGRVTRIQITGLPDGGEAWARWSARLPVELSYGVATAPPDVAGVRSTLCAGFPVFQLFSNGTANATGAQQSWSYGSQTWHTTRDTYDKVVFDEVAKNAVFTAMVAYLAAEDPVRTAFVAAPRDLMDPATGAARAITPCPLPPPFKQ